MPPHIVNGCSESTGHLPGRGCTIARAFPCSHAHMHRPFGLGAMPIWSPQQRRLGLPARLRLSPAPYAACASTPYRTIAQAYAGGCTAYLACLSAHVELKPPLPLELRRRAGSISLLIERGPPTNGAMGGLAGPGRYTGTWSGLIKAVAPKVASELYTPTGHVSGASAMPISTAPLFWLSGGLDRS